MEKRKTKKKRINEYPAKFGCWNCDAIRTFKIKKGMTVPDFLMNLQPICAKCGCNSLKPHIEWITEKKIMKELVLHHRIEQLHESDEGEKKDHDHYR